MEPRHLAAIKKIAGSKLIRMPQLMLMVMANKHMAGWTMTNLNKATGVIPSVLTMAKNKLTKEKHVIEHSLQRDRRVTKIYLTEKGHAEAHAMWSAMRALVGAEKAIRACEA